MSAITLHPAARRRMLATLPPAPPDDVALRPIGAGGGNAMIVTAGEPSFLAALFADLSRDDWRQRLAARRGLRRGPDGMLELGLPTHRRFHVVLLEAVCRTAGSPRLDPAKLDSMGLVLRRVETGGSLSGWLKDGPAPRGWQPLAATSGQDPDPARRDLPRPGAAGQIQAMIAAIRHRATLAEDITPLFMAPPAVCAARGRTILYGIVPVASSERSASVDLPDFNDLPDDEADAVIGHLSGYLKARSALSLPRAGALLDPGWNVLQDPDPASVEAGRLNVFGIFLHQLQVELGAFEGGDAAKLLLAELAQITLQVPLDEQATQTEPMTAAAFVAAAAPILIGAAPNVAQLRMPAAWPSVDPAQGSRLTQRALACITQRYRQIVTETPKFDRDENRYSVRPFLRVAGHDACPPKLVWSDAASEPFRILPWWDGDGPATRIALPSLARLRAIKPNVTFELPAALANLLNGDMKKLKDGEGSPPSELGIGWLCSFSLPIITLCAFIVLNIFLKLFDIVFFWMAFLKICIPYPKKKSA